VLFREGEEVGVGGVFGVFAPGWKLAAGGEVVGEESVMGTETGQKVFEAICCFLNGNRISGFLDGYADKSEFHYGCCVKNDFRL